MNFPPLRLFLPTSISFRLVEPYRHRRADVGLLSNTGLNHFFRHSCQATGWIHKILRIPVGEIEIQLFDGGPALVL